VNGLFSNPFNRPHFTNIVARGHTHRFTPPLHGTVEEKIERDRPGRVHCFGSYWPAELAETDAADVVSPCQPVAVVARRGMTMFVASVDES